MKLKYLSIFLLIAIMMPSVQAACLTDSERNALFNLTETIGLDTAHSYDMLMLFENMCERVAESEEIRNETMVFVEEYLNNWTEEFEEMSNIADAMIAIQNLIEASSNISRIQEMVNRELTGFEDSIDSRFIDIRDDMNAYLRESEFDDYKSFLVGNLTILIDRKFAEYQANTPKPVDPMVIISLLAALAVLGWYGYRHYTKKSSNEAAYSNAVKEMKEMGITPEVDKLDRQEEEISKKIIQELDSRKKIRAKKIEDQSKIMKHHLKKKDQEIRSSLKR